jgi:hypothetical protein
VADRNEEQKLRPGFYIGILGYYYKISKTGGIQTTEICHTFG